jgi:DNA-binding NarL/FixJ family response regulator
MDLSLPDQSGFELLPDLVPIPSKPTVAILVLTLMGHRTLWEIAKSYGVYECFHAQHTTGEDLDRAIQRAVALVKQMPKEGPTGLSSAVGGFFSAHS